MRFQTRQNLPKQRLLLTKLGMSKESPTNETSAYSDAHHAHVGPILGVLVVILVLILGGLYLWGSMLSESQNEARVERTIPNNEPETPRAEADRQILETTSPSTELDAIYADLESANLDALDAELDQIDAEMSAALR
jgi:hypothetical protein